MMTQVEQPRLLVVDDQENNRFTLVHRLNRLGYTCIDTATNGREALECLRSCEYDLVLLDIMMPEMDGFQVLENIHKDMKLRDVPVVMISAVDEIESIARCIQLGAHDFLFKPFNPILLAARVAACLDRKRLHDQEKAYLRMIETERARSDRLLRALVPPSAVRELKSNDTIPPKRFEGVAVLFCDVVGFTDFCDTHTPTEITDNLQELIIQLEDIGQRYGLEKIKTVGDAFLATAGLLQPIDEPGLASVKCAFDMITASESLESGWQIRVGIHLGPVIAGVMGSRQFVFDIWGDTVNTAARIVSAAPPSSVVVSQEIWQCVRDHYDGRSTGPVSLKGKGSLELIECLQMPRFTASDGSEMKGPSIGGSG